MGLADEGKLCFGMSPIAANTFYDSLTNPPYATVYCRTSSSPTLLAVVMAREPQSDCGKAAE